MNLALTNWRGVGGPPDLTDDQRAALTARIEVMHRSKTWQETLARNDWFDLYQAGPAFDAFLNEEHARATRVLGSIGLIK